MHRVIKISFLVTMLSLLCLGSFAQARFYTEVNKNKLSMSENLVVKFTLENANTRSFAPPDFDGFTVVGGPQQMQSHQWVNGVSSSSLSWTYYLRANKEGTLTIGSASVQDGSNILKSNVVKIEVTGGQAPVQQNSTNPTATNQNKQTAASGDYKEDVFVKVIPSKTSVYVGEPVAVTYKLYVAKPAYNLNYKEQPNYNGFWKYEYDISPNQKSEQEVVNGKRFETLILEKVLLFPQRSGNISISPLSMECVIQERVQRKARDIFEQMFGGNVSVQNVPYSFKSPSLTISVKDLPEAGKPDDFHGLVGDFKVQSSIDKHQAKVDDPITYKLKISGTGNFDVLKNPDIEMPNGFEVYDPDVTDKISKSSGSISGNKELTYLMIPRLPGKYKLPPLKFSYFDLSKKQYIELQTEAFDIEVTGQPSTQVAANNTASNKADIAILNEDIRYIHGTQANWQKQEKPLFHSKVFYTLAVVPFAFIGLLLFVAKKREENLADAVGNKMRNASKSAIKRLHKAKSYLQENKTKAFYAEINSAVWSYVSDKLNIETAELNRELAVEKLNEQKINASLIAELISLIDHCEMSVFSPGSEEGDMEKTYHHAVEIITKIENDRVKS